MVPPQRQVSNAAIAEDKPARPYRQRGKENYFFFVGGGVCLAAAALLFFCWLLLVLTCFCAAFLFVAFGDLSPIRNWSIAIELAERQSEKMIDLLSYFQISNVNRTSDWHGCATV